MFWCSDLKKIRIINVVQLIYLIPILFAIFFVQMLDYFSHHRGIN
jgi:hypothetical protein